MPTGVPGYGPDYNNRKPTRTPTDDKLTKVEIWLKKANKAKVPTEVSPVWPTTETPGHSQSPPNNPKVPNLSPARGPSRILLPRSLHLKTLLLRILLRVLTPRSQTPKSFTPEILATARVVNHPPKTLTANYPGSRPRAGRARSPPKRG